MGAVAFSLKMTVFNCEVEEICQYLALNPGMTVGQLLFILLSHDCSLNALQLYPPSMSQCYSYLERVWIRAYGMENGELSNTSRS
jgi:hypothetical protein